VSIDELVRGGFAQRMAEFRDKVGKRPVYLCFDMDFFDRSWAPGVCRPAWGGPSAREGLALIAGLAGLRFVSFDIYTVSPPHDVGGMTAFLAATCMRQFLVLACKSLGLTQA